MHRYVGLAMAVFLVVAGVTGSFLAFYHELDVALNPELFRAPIPAQDASLLDPFSLRARAESQLPGGFRIRSVVLDARAGESVEFRAIPPDGFVEGTFDENYFFSPHTGEMMGSRDWGNLSQGRRNIMPFLLRLHYALALGDIGAALFGIVALLWTLDCFVGAYLTFPSPRASHGPSRRTWLARWKPSWLVRGARLFSFMFTWHRASGLWVWAMLFVFAWSAVALNLSVVYQPVMDATLGMKESFWRTKETLETPREMPMLSFERAHALARDALARQAVKHDFEVHDERRLYYDPQSGTYGYTVRTSLDVSDRYPSTTVWIDGDSGDLVALDLPTGQAAGNTVTQWLYHLHFGSIAGGGWPYQAFVSLMGLLITALSVTGGWIWWRKRSKRSGPTTQDASRGQDRRLLPPQREEV